MKKTCKRERGIEKLLRIMDFLFWKDYENGDDLLLNYRKFCIVSEDVYDDCTMNRVCV